jgi:hypothetical protein
MKLLFVSATVLAGLSAQAWATSINELRIDASTNGSVTTLSVIQEDSVLGNTITNTLGGHTSLPIKGSWNSIVINQQGGNNTLYGSVKAGAGSTTASLNASYAGGGNTHSLTIGTTTAPVNPTVVIAVTGGGSNTITDTLDGTSLNYNLTLAGASNGITNAIGATGAVALTETITGDSNTIGNTVTGATSYTQHLTVNGSSNNIANTISGGGANSLTQDIESSSNVITTNLLGGGQTATLSLDANSLVTYTQNSSGAGSNAYVTLNHVTGSSTAAVVNVTQTALATNAVATLLVNGGSYTTGTTLAGGAGINVSQNSPGAILNASVAAAGNGYTANFTQ